MFCYCSACSAYRGLPLPLLLTIYVLPIFLLTLCNLKIILPDRRTKKKRSKMESEEQFPHIIPQIYTTDLVQFLYQFLTYLTLNINKACYPYCYFCNLQYILGIFLSIPLNYGERYRSRYLSQQQGEENIWNRNKERRN